MNLSQETIALIKGLRKDVTTNGIATGTGLNFYYLEPQAKNIYPVFYPLLASTPRVNPMFNGMKVGGLATNWKAIVGIDAGGYPGVSEGNRNAYMSMTKRDFSSTYKFLGKDIQTSFQSQQTGLGFEDNVALAQLSLMNALLNDEERMLLFGNSGPASVGGNGYALGTTPTPVLTQSNTSGAAVANSAQNYVFCVALTPWGVQLATATGVRLPFLRTNADSSQDVINGGTAIRSVVSNSVVTDASHKSITATVTAVNGAVGYAWYLNQADNTAALAKFVGITATPSVIIMATPSAANQNAAAVDSTSTKDLTTDNSYNILDFDGIMTWKFGTYGSSQPAYLKDLGGAGFTSNGDGSIAEFEACADYLWQNYKASVDKIYVGGSLIQSVSRAVLTGSSTTGAQRIVIERGGDGSISGGQIIRTYHWKYSTSGAPKEITVATHPWLPDGCVLFDVTTNPYPAAGDAIPAVRRIVSLEDHFSIKWPYRKLQHEIGVYCFETLQDYLPFVGGMLTGAANKVN